jgi:hypothetical protein
MADSDNEDYYHFVGQMSRALGSDVSTAFQRRLAQIYSTANKQSGDKIVFNKWQMAYIVHQVSLEYPSVELFALGFFGDGDMNMELVL